MVSPARVQEWWRETCGLGEIRTPQLFFTRVQRGGWCGLYWEQEGEQSPLGSGDSPSPRLSKDEPICEW